MDLADVLAAVAEHNADLAAARRRKPRKVRIGRGVPGVPGPRPLEVCTAGLHDMAEHGRQTYKTKPDGSKVRNGRYCIGCKRKRERTPGAAERPNAQGPRRRPADTLTSTGHRKGQTDAGMC